MPKKLAPQVTAPHSLDNFSDVDAFAKIRVNQVYIGACIGAKLSRLKMAVRVLKGRKVAPGVRLQIAPLSTCMTAVAAADGTLATFTAAGAILLPPGCGTFADYGAGILAEDENCISSAARNFCGRVGATSSSVYLGSPYKAAARAATGFVTDPRALMSEQVAA
jgi:3-isopropylmalate/(R)-2-methylmalate dehydratase large subunit